MKEEQARRKRRFPWLQRRREDLTCASHRFEGNEARELCALNLIIHYGVEDYLAEDAEAFGWPLVAIEPGRAMSDLPSQKARGSWTGKIVVHDPDLLQRLAQDADSH